MKQSLLNRLTRLRCRKNPTYSDVLRFLLNPDEERLPLKQQNPTSAYEKRGLGIQLIAPSIKG